MMINCALLTRPSRFVSQSKSRPPSGVAAMAAIQGKLVMNPPVTKLNPRTSTRYMYSHDTKVNSK
jgi:hypothetical protein